ncbi:hypothetical protein SMICM17S_07253 [Streptomyces microflavus]
MTCRAVSSSTPVCRGRQAAARWRAGRPAGPAAIATAQLAAGLPLLLWGVHRRSGGWAAAGAVLLAQGALGLAYHRAREAAERS